MSHGLYNSENFQDSKTKRLEPLDLIQQGIDFYGLLYDILPCSRNISLVFDKNQFRLKSLTEGTEFFERPDFSKIVQNLQETIKERRKEFDLSLSQHIHNILKDPSLIQETIMLEKVLIKVVKAGESPYYVLNSITKRNN